MKKKLRITLLLLSLSWSNLFSQAAFIKTFGGEWRDGAYDLKKTQDQCYIVTGFTDRKQVWTGTKTKFYSNIYLAKISRSGELVWSKTYAPSNYQIATSVFTNSDGGFSVFGEVQDSVNNRTDFFVLRTDDKGNQLSLKLLHIDCIAMQIVQVNDNLFMITQPPYDSIYKYSQMTKMDSYGNTLWKTDIKAEISLTYAIAKTSDNGFIMSGENTFLLKTDSLGNVIWKKDKLFTDSTIAAPIISDIIEDRNGGFFCAGSKPVQRYGEYDQNMLYIKTDKEGNVLWRTVVSGEYSKAEGCVQTHSGEYIACGMKNKFPALAKIDTSGNVQWVKLYGVRGLQHTLNSIIYTSEHKIVSAGIMGQGYSMELNDMVLIKTNNTGEVTKVSTDDINELLKISLEQNYPNPFNPITKIKYSISMASHVSLRVYDLLGKEVKTLVNEFKHSGVYDIELNGAELLVECIYILCRLAGIEKVKSCCW